MTKIRKSGLIKAAAIVAVVVLAGWYGVHLYKKAHRPTPVKPAIPVTVGVAKSQDIPVYVSGLGTVQAFNTVTIKSRVDGQITQVLFKEGQEVKAGDPLFVIDPRPYQATLEQAQGSLQRDQAQLEGAQRDLDRYEKLVTPGFQTRQSYEDQKATVGQLQGSVKTDQALIDSAKLNIEYANVRAPIDGRTGARLVDTGNFVQASAATNLVTITQLKPIFVTFTVPQDALDQIRENQAKAPLNVVAYASDNKTILATGKLTLINNQVDTTTGTVQLKATFENTDERLWPGEFINTRLIVTVKKDAVTVPSQAIMQGPAGAYAYILKSDDTVDRQDVQIGLTQDGIATIDKGLSAGQTVVVEGQYRLTNGSKVKIRPSQAQSQPAH
jgi:multidrug efflux system membrane fusion protein